MPCSQAEGRLAAMNQSSCYSATVSHMNRVCSVLRDPIPKFTSFRGSERGNETESGKALGKRANSLPEAQVSSDGAGQRAQSRRCTHTAVSMGRWGARQQQHDCRNGSPPRLPLSKSCRGAACGESGSRIPSWLLRACRVSSEGQGGVHP